MKDEPSYCELHRRGELHRRIEEAWTHLEACDLCAHVCRVNRRLRGRGVCRTGTEIRVASYGPHFGEEEVLVGTGGSGTIFFSGCNLRCVFCQNWEISHLREGVDITAQELARMMLDLEARGCHNINLVTPTPYLPQILSALEIACDHGLSLPLVYNCGGYESLTALTLLRGLVDIYMPDVKFADEEVARRLTGAGDYFAVVKRALKEMHAQVGALQIGEDGLARRGLLVRHLVLPDGLAGTKEVLTFIAREISRDTYLNLMDQYFPHYRAKEHPPLDRPLTSAEYQEALAIAHRLGLWRLA
ncbi:MAG: radical SAM protein [Firmicutes bacterium]|nr:radical SAM protein [Bacillota bacterium]